MGGRGDPEGQRRSESVGVETGEQEDEELTLESMLSIASTTQSGFSHPSSSSFSAPQIKREASSAENSSTRASTSTQGATAA